MGVGVCDGEANGVGVGVADGLGVGNKVGCGDGDGDVYATPGTTFASSSNIDITTSGSIRIIGL